MTAIDRRVLAVVGEVIGMLELTELCDGLVVALREAVPAEFCAINEVPGDAPGAISVADPPMSASTKAAWVRHGHENPLVRHFQRRHDGRATRFSDVITRRELHRLDIYREIYGPLGVEYQVAFLLPSRSDRILGVALSRARRDFTIGERDLLNRARPYLIQAYRNALSYCRLADGRGRSVAVADLEALGLSRRQAEMLRLVAMGRSDRDAAEQLGISLRTAQKHLERTYRVLGVDNRSRAAALAWEAAGTPPA